MKTSTTILLIGGAIAAYLLFAPKGNVDGGSGGSLNIPNFGDMIGSSGTQNPAQDNNFQISDKIMAAMTATDKKATPDRTVYNSTYSNLSGGALMPSTSVLRNIPVTMTNEQAGSLYQSIISGSGTKKASTPAPAKGANSSSIGWRSSNVTRGGHAGGWGV